MNSATANMVDPLVERQRATAFVTDLIVCRQHIQSYPESHPVVAASLRKTIDGLAPLLSGGKPLTLGISRHGVLLKSEALGAEIAKFKDFASLLASFGIITISFTSQMAPEDIHLLNGIISRPRKEVWEGGGIRRAFATAGIETIKVQAIDPSVFVLTDELRKESVEEGFDPWLVFVRRLLEGYFSVSKEEMQRLMMGAPDELGKDFDAVLSDIPEEARYQTIRAMADFFILLEGKHGLSEDALNKITSFITGISPPLRRAFILNICNSSSVASGFSERLLQHLPGDALLEAMHSVATHGENIPDMVLQIMQKLSANAETTPALDAAITTPDSSEKVKELLKESSFEQFIPPAYQNTLMTILATDTLPVTETSHLEELRRTLDTERLEAKIGDIIFEIIRAIPAAERGEGIRRNLLGLMSHYLTIRDFPSLEQTCRMIADEARTDNADPFDAGFVREILDAARLLNRENLQNIRSIIGIIGGQCVIPLMERLFAEQNRSLRRFWFDCLADLGDMVRNAALDRLNDERWFVIRNLVIMLRNLNDQDVQRQVRRLIVHPHPKVRQEVLKSLFIYRDPTADNLLIQDLESSDPSRKMTAVQAAELSSSPEVVRRLLAILESGGITDYGLELKSAAVLALATIGDLQALPKLKSILFSGSFLHPGKHLKLKVVIIRALPRFPLSRVRPLLEEIALTGAKNIAPLAAETLKGLQETGP